ncbi:MAG: hypothetical protein H0T45_17610 [Pyrinomonadaceae bacterium]|nr:hypothetical protein [Pyrinomonadaceae bacterium]
MKPEVEIPNELFIVSGEEIERVLRRAVRHALLQHKRAGNPIATWRDGRVVWIPAEEIQVEDDADSNSR